VQPSSPIPRPEYPRPALVRARWQSLNGRWELGYDPGDRGLRDGWQSGRRFERSVVVPFPLESALSGVVDPEPPPVVWYRRHFQVPHAWLEERTVLHVGACDYEAQLFVNGRGVGSHRGGYAPIACEVGHALHSGENEVVLRVSDPPTWSRPRGKQWAGAVRTPVDYDTVTGIWQSVWLEPLPPVSIAELWTRFALETGELAVHVALSEPVDAELEAVLRDGEREVARARGATFGRIEARLRLPVPSPALWSPASPHLYELHVRLLEGGRESDRAQQWVGLREVAARDGRLLLNGEPLYLRGVLDQGYFPGGWYAAPSDEALRRDVELTRALGFNCARKHQKAEDPRYLYWADRLGLLVWSEMPSGRDFTGELVESIGREWPALVRRDRSHACVMAWVPFNESWGVWRQAERRDQRAFVEGMVGITRALDPTRPVVGNDGWEYAAGDLWTLHLYEGDRPDVSADLRRLLRDPHGDVLPPGQPLGRRVGALPGADVRGLPVLLTECGGIGFVPPEAERPEHPLFAYGKLPATAAELEERIRAVAAAIAGCPELSGFVWTQLSDVQQEMNGLLDFERRPKLPAERLRAIFEAIG
jgi:beta-galactosidase/beta-glucuronidase